MAKRFGRNQKRQAKEQIASLLRDNAIISKSALEHGKRMAARHAAELRHARMARDTIKITVDDLLDPQDQRIQMRARFDMLGTGRECLNAAMDMDPRGVAMWRSDQERQAFVDGVGRAVAEYALAAIMRCWRSR